MNPTDPNNTNPVAVDPHVSTQPSMAGGTSGVVQDNSSVSQPTVGETDVSNTNTMVGGPAVAQVQPDPTILVDPMAPPAPAMPEPVVPVNDPATPVVPATPTETPVTEDQNNGGMPPVTQ